MQPDLRGQLAQARSSAAAGNMPRHAWCHGVPVHALHMTGGCHEPFAAIGRLAVIVAGLAGALLALRACAASAFAAALAPLGGDPHGRPGLPPDHPGVAAPAPLPPGWHSHPPLLPTLTRRSPAACPAGRSPSWWRGPVLLAAALAVAAYRIRSARQRVSTSTAN